MRHCVGFIACRTNRTQPPPVRELLALISQKKLDAAIDAGLITVEGREPAVKDQTVFLGRKGYDDDQRKKLQEQHQLNSSALSSMMNDALHGQMTDESIVALFQLISFSSHNFPNPFVNEQQKTL